ncbi:MAG: recombinase RecQ [Gemmatimonadetes bacterium]|mgnify:CR=1 FL=1|nr:recombinase RecQ [Gemmatimonadota bacterium]|tara:strand:- start:4107 stop:6011 length:1905 start_codon:yes stop_codon:yes gene_type:complete
MGVLFEEQRTVEEGLGALGFERFLPGQREAIDVLLDSGRLLLVAPTGGGKSLTYQLPASMLPGTTLVVSPLIALMNDQVRALEERGTPATYLAGTLDGDEMRDRLGRLARGEYKLVYVAPERLVFDGFRATISQIECPLVAVDEAHCISEWGHDFRPDYMRIGDLLEALPSARVLACTATATPIVRDEILERLGLPADTPQLVKGFARPNLAFRVHEVQGKPEARTRVDRLLRESLERPDGGKGRAIVYSPTRKRTDEEADRLREAGWRSEAYHAGMNGERRDRVQEAFAAGEVEVVVATNAFGMGIDRHDVRCIIHLAPPGSVEAYYQEAGRAGRDGEDAVCALLVSPGDMPLRRFLIESDTEGRIPDENVVRHKWNLFLELMRWAEGGSCRHDTILRYFGDEEETLSGCGKCDVCLTMDDGNGESEDTATIVRKALCGVARVHGRFGIQVAAKLLGGVDDDRLDWSKLNATPTFGTLADHSEDWILRLLRRCVTVGWVDFHGGQRPVVVVTEEGQEVIHERRPARLLLPPERTVKVASTSALRKGPGRDDDGSVLDGPATAIFEALRVWRLETARAAHVPPYVVANDRTLRDVASMGPANEDDLLQAHGIGPAKLEKYGSEILRVVLGVAAS